MSQLDLEKLYKQQKIEEDYINAVNYFSQVQKEAFIKYLTNINEQYLLEYRTAQQRKAQKKRRQWSEPSGKIPPELIQAYLNVDSAKRAQNTYLVGWGAHKSDSTNDGSGKSIMYDPTRDFENKEKRRSMYKGYYTYSANNTAYPENELDSDPDDSYNNTINALTGKSSSYANTEVNGFTMEIDYGKCKYELLDKQEAFNYLGISSVRNVTLANNASNVPWLNATANPSEHLPSNENRVAFIANNVNSDTFETNLSSLRFLFRDETGKYKLISYDDSHIITNKQIMQLWKIMIPRRCFDQGDLHISFPKGKNNQTTVDSSYIDRRVNGVLLVIMLADKIYKTDELQHRLINSQAAPSEEIRRHLNFRYLGLRDSSGNITRSDTNSAPNINVLFNVLSKNYMNSQKFSGLSLSPLYNEYLYLSTIAEILNSASGFKDVEDWGQITADNLKEFMLREENKDIFVSTNNPEEYRDPDRNEPFNNNYPSLLNDLKVLNIYRNAQPIEDYINNRVDDEHFVFLKEIANIEGDYSYFTLNVNLTIYFTNEAKDAISAYKVTGNTSDKKVLSTLSRDITEKIYGKIIDIYFPPEDAEYKRLNNLYKRNIFNRLIITKPKRKGAYLRPAANNPEDPNFINNFQTFQPLQNYLSVLSDDSNLVYDLILDTGDHNPTKTNARDRQYGITRNEILKQLATAWQVCKDNKKAMLHDKKAYERVLKNRASYTGDDGEEDYQDDLNDAKEVYETSLNAYKHALKQKQAIINKYCNTITQTTLYIERAIVEYFTILEGKLKLLRQLKNKVLSLESYSLDDIFKEFKGEGSPLLQQIEKKMEELQKLLQEQEIQLQRIQQRKAELQTKIADLQRQLAEATQNLANSETEEQEVNQVKSQIQTQLKELNDAKQPDNAKAVSDYYRTREQAEEVCISLGNDIDKFRKSVFKPEGSTAQTNNANNKAKKVETNPKILEALDLMEETVDAVAEGLKADEKDKEIIETLPTDPKVEDILDDGENDSNQDNN